MKAIVVRIRKDGSIQAETRDIKGDACLPWIRALEELTDARTVDSRYTSEFYESAEEASSAVEQLEEPEGRS
jgi:hypothetical protein